MENQEFKKQLIARAFNLAKSSFRLVDKFPNKRSTQVISNQLLRAISSIGANIVEAQAASSGEQFKVQSAKLKVMKRSKNFKFLTKLLTLHFEFLTEEMSW